jgi:hypothetical protein
MEIGYEKMQMSIGVGFDGKEYITFFGNNSQDIEKLGDKFDKAKQIVIFGHKGDVSDNNYKFNLSSLESYENTSQKREKTECKAGRINCLIHMRLFWKRTRHRLGTYHPKNF